MDTPKATVVLKNGEPSEWETPRAYARELESSGNTRVIVSVPCGELKATHGALVAVMDEPLSLLYRQTVNRLNPAPEGSPNRDFVSLELTTERVLAAIDKFSPLFHHDARCELWVRGQLGDQVILDADGVLFCYPDDPAFADALDHLGVPSGLEGTILDQDYAKHWFHAENDDLERQFIAQLRLTEVPPQSR